MTLDSIIELFFFLSVEGIQKWGAEIAQENNKLNSALKEKEKEMKRKEEELRKKEKQQDQMRIDYENRLSELESEKQAAIERAREEADRADEASKRADSAEDRADAEAERADEERLRAEAEAQRAQNAVNAAPTPQLSEAMANLVASLGEQIKAHIPQNTGLITGQEDDQQPEVKRRKVESEFNLNGSLVTCAEYKGMSFDGLTYHNAVKNIMRQKIMRDEVFDLEKIYAVSEHAEEYRQSVFDLQSSNTPAKLTIKTIPEFFEALYLFGIFYLQKYPEKTASFLEYALYISF